MDNSLTDGGEIVSKCIDCCAIDQKYDIAVIEADKRYTKQFFPEIYSILLDKSLSKYVKFRSTNGNRPSMLLYNNIDSKKLASLKANEKKELSLELDASNKPVETLNIAGWDKTTIAEYLFVNVKF